MQYHNDDVDIRTQNNTAQLSRQQRQHLLNVYILPLTRAAYHDAGHDHRQQTQHDDASTYFQARLRR